MPEAIGVCVFSSSDGKISSTNRDLLAAATTTAKGLEASGAIGKSVYALDVGGSLKLKDIVAQTRGVIPTCLIPHFEDAGEGVGFLGRMHGEIDESIEKGRFGEEVRPTLIHPDASRLSDEQKDKLNSLGALALDASSPEAFSESFAAAIDARVGKLGALVAAAKARKAAAELKEKIAAPMEAPTNIAVIIEKNPTTANPPSREDTDGDPKPLTPKLIAWFRKHNFTDAEITEIRNKPTVAERKKALTAIAKGKGIVEESADGFLIKVPPS
jgi:hypothetical protein